MRKIKIDERVKQLADRYREEIINNLSFSKLEEFEKDIDYGKKWLSDKKYEENAKLYVKLITNRIKLLQYAPPDKFIHIIGGFEGLIKGDELGKLKLCYQWGKKVITKSFHEWIVEQMHYSEVRGRIFPKYIRELGIKTCVYCNSQFAITTKDGLATYELDHCWPKSKYPYLCTNFFNMQPCCGTCNKNKGDNSFNGDYSFLSIWQMPGGKGRLFGYRISDSSLAKYCINSQLEDLEIEYYKEETRESYEKTLADFEDKMKIIRTYAEHKDVVEEMIWKSKIYNSSYISSLKDAFSKEFGGGEGDWLRFFYGTYMKYDESHKRPLSELIQDIVEQLRTAE